MHNKQRAQRTDQVKPEEADCPPWCRMDHSPGEHPEDLAHATANAPLAVVMMGQDEEGKFHTLPGLVDVVRFKWIGQAHPACNTDQWVFIGSDLSGVVVTVESATRIFQALGDVLAFP